MKFAKRGKITSAAEVTKVSPHGLRLLIDRKEHFLPFDHFPWFRDATISEIGNVERPSPKHLYWPDLDVDLSMDSIQKPEAFPLVAGSKTTRHKLR